ncbi:HD-GYP domain-containing protein [Oceanidesulfovibrio marinus]|uniref:Metal-dependent phosphohydrolase n=1 Tax=Oceanidesulfovibrio marinus TaxID=370038 RepID=A0A6P1ZJV3_9BACT|nr:HD domain-containing phosphohydrolase [Oceanidesulfovibrio marinus]TVM34059.1 metal-dependent phosphohydrolase [Oceanidesulfovibrio marinus]
MQPSPKQQEQAESGKGPRFIPFSPLFILPSTRSGFTVLLNQNDRLVLYAKGGDIFTEAHRQRLLEMGVERVYVRAEEKGFYEEYMRSHLGELLDDETIPPEDRAAAWYQTSIGITREIFQNRLSTPATGKRFAQIEGLVKDTSAYLADPKALKKIAAYIQRGFHLYDHALGVMVLTVSLLRTFPQADDELLFRVGMGAILHDIGKTTLPEYLLQKRSDLMTPEERRLFRTHPAAGIAVLAGMTLESETLHCILFHHEQSDGKGYPAGVASQELPLHARALILCNAYDNLTRATPDGPAKNPFEALTQIKADRERYDIECIKRLIMVLSNAEIA